MAQTTGRVIAHMHSVDEAGNDITTLHFTEGTKLVVAGRWELPHLVTLQIKHKRNGTDPDTIKKVTLMGLNGVKPDDNEEA